MRAWMQPIIYWVNEYYGNRWYLLLAIVAYIYLFFATKESRRKIVYPSVLLAFLVLNPILYQYVYSKIIYWRFGVAVAKYPCNCVCYSFVCEKTKAY